MHFVIASGCFRGPRITLSSNADGGSEWDTVRGDGTILFESRQVLYSAGGDPVCMSVSGLFDYGDDGYVHALDDALVSKARATFAVQFQTAAKEYRWLNRSLFVGYGERDFGSHSFQLQIFDLN